ncbi:MAG: alanine racemase [Fibrobacterota bacterium]
MAAVQKWIEIDTRNLLHNLSILKRNSDGAELCAVVKANAYGHGTKTVVPVFSKAGVSVFAVHSLREAREVRASDPTARIIILGYTPLELLDETASEGFEISLTNHETARKLCESPFIKNSGKTGIHIKFETGTNRQGLSLPDIEKILKHVSGNTAIEIKGIYTHFANIEDTTDPGFAKKQMDVFREGAEILKDKGLYSGPLHVSCSAAVMLFPEFSLDMVRPGISLYGFWSSSETELSYRERGGKPVEFKPALTFKTVIGQIKKVPKGETVGYGRTFKCLRDSVIAVLPVGYSDGYPRNLGGNSYCLIKGERAPIIGRICMNMMMADITDIEGVSLEDEAVLIGSQGNEEVNAHSLAKTAGTIHYDILSGLRPEIPRIVN